MATMTPTSKRARPTTPFDVLTVGDGDLSLSLALARAYGKTQISLTASTIVRDVQDLVRLYPHADAIVQELGERHVHIRWGVDATKLHETFLTMDNDETCQKFDLVLFYHPHLGIVKDTTEAERARRHECLLAHYLASAGACLKTTTSKVHVCLCGTQPDTWKVYESAKRLGLTHVPSGKPTTAAPWHIAMHLPHLQEESNMVNAQGQGFAAPRKYRNGKQGSRHWLGKYGYCHRRTQGELYEGLATDTNVESSVDLLFQPTTIESVVQPWAQRIIERDDDIVCPVCLTKSPSKGAHRRHLEAPALPCDIQLVQQSRQKAVEDQDAETKETVKNAVQPGVRLRKYVQKQFGRTKAGAGQLIHAGKVLVNGEPVTDSARWVYETTQIAIKDEADVEDDKQESTVSPPMPSTPIQIVARLDGSIYVVWKPVGLRTKGQFPGTLENLVALQEKMTKMESLTRLDTGLSGLCLLYEVSSNPRTCSVRHCFTGLVVGHVESSWRNGVELWLKTDRRRRWGKGPTTDIDQSDKVDEEESTYRVKLRVTESSLIAGKSDGEEEVLNLSTIRVDVADNLSGIGSLLTYALRKQLNLRVVGDRFSNKEYVKLPRSIRNRIKQKICLGCSAITFDGKEYEYPVPDKWKANYWAAFLENANAASSRDLTT